MSWPGHEARGDLLHFCGPIGRFGGMTVSQSGQGSSGDLTRGREGGTGVGE
jgi:hypothetical protein